VKPILVYGSREFGQVVRDLAGQCGHPFAGFIDDVDRGPEILGTWQEVSRNRDPALHSVAMAIGYHHLAERRALCERVRAQGYETPALIHSRAYVRDAAAVGAGSFVMAGAVVDFAARVGPFAVIWPGATINHHAEVGANTFISPNATVCGYSVVGENCFVGAGATIVDHRTVPAGSFVKAGSVYAGDAGKEHA
jgi:sugar O-acyltransferase (sialic acid O-acetyltransferase NeuD family)